MQMKAIFTKNGISFFFVALFLATKLLGLHGIAHGDDQRHLDHCAICHNIAADSHAPALLHEATDPLPPRLDFFLQNTVEAGYDYRISCTPCPSLLFSRPPPSA